MNLLIDTHVLLWYLIDDSKLSEVSIQKIENPSNNNYVSIASLWEIAIKINIGKLDLSIPFKKLEKEILKNNFNILSVGFDHTLKLTKLEHHHRDPFDRILICQALVENLTIITKDLAFSEYKGVKTSW